MSGFTQSALELRPEEQFISKPFQLPELYARLAQAMAEG